MLLFSLRKPIWLWPAPSPSKSGLTPGQREELGAKGLGVCKPSESGDLKEEHFCHLAGKQAERRGSSFKKQTHCTPITDSVFTAFPTWRKPDYKMSECVSVC